MEDVKLVFRNKITGQEVVLRLVSKVSIITGLSGIGKTWFYNEALSNDSEFVEVICG